MAISNQPNQGFRVNTQEIHIGAVTYEQATADAHDVDHSAVAAKMLAKSGEQKALEIKTYAQEASKVEPTSVFDAHMANIADDGQHYRDRVLAAVHVLASCLPTEQDGIELIDMLCAGAARKIERKDRDVARLAREYRSAVEADHVTEIGALALHDAEDRLNDMREQVDLWENLHTTFARAYEQTAMTQWQDRSTIAKDRVNATDQAAAWESQMRHFKLAKMTKIVVVGGNDVGREQVKARIEQAAAKVGGDKLAIVTGDGDSGFERMVRDLCDGLGILSIAVPLADRKAPDRYFRRNEAMFGTMHPQGAIVMAGGGVQGHIIELARKHSVAIDVPVCPKGWTRDGSGLRKVG